MTTIASAMPAMGRAAGAEPALAGHLAVVDLAGAERAWRELEATAVMAPYGRFDWVAAYAAGTGDEIRVAIRSDEAGRPSILLPVCTERRFGLRLATSVGGKHTNLTLPLVRPDIAFALNPASAGALMREMGCALGVDALVLDSVPAVWEGRPLPWAAGGRQSPSDAVSLPLAGDGEATLMRSMSSDARKKLRNKSRGLAKLGPVEVAMARDEAAIDACLDAFYRQKESRFRDLGIADPFADPATKAFLRRGALAGLAAGTPAIELYGLRVGDRIVAVLGGAADYDRLSGMMLAFEQSDVAKFSPGEILVTRVIALLCEQGRRHFDLGVGDARYKRVICDETMPLCDLVVPVTARGHAYAAAKRGLTGLKRGLKRNPAAMAAIGKARKALAAVRR